MRAEPDRDAGRADGADVELALGADVEELHPEGDRGCEPGEDQRRRQRERVRPRCAAEEGGVEEPPVRVERIVPGGEEHAAMKTNATTTDTNGTAYVSQRGCLSRRSTAITLRPVLSRCIPGNPGCSAREPLGSPEPPSRETHEPAHASPPAIASPISSIVAVVGSNSPVSSPFVHHHDPVGQGEDLVEVLADQQHRDSFSGRLSKVRVHGLDRADVEPSRRRSGDQHLRATRELPAEDELLQVSAGQVAGPKMRPRCGNGVPTDQVARDLADHAPVQERAEGDPSVHDRT